MSALRWSLCVNGIAFTRSQWRGRKQLQPSFPYRHPLFFSSKSTLATTRNRLRNSLHAAASRAAIDIQRRFSLVFPGRCALGDAREKESERERESGRALERLRKAAGKERSGKKTELSAGTRERRWEHLRRERVFSCEIFVNIPPRGRVPRGDSGKGEGLAGEREGEGSAFLRKAERAEGGKNKSFLPLYVERSNGFCIWQGPGVSVPVLLQRNATYFARGAFPMINAGNVTGLFAFKIFHPLWRSPG